MTENEKGTSSESVDGRRTTIPQYIAAIVVNLAALSHGITLGWPSPMLPLLKDNSTLTDGPLNTDEASWVVSLVNLGAFTASPIFTYVANFHRRKVAGYLIGISPVICWGLILFTKSKIILYVLRFFLGMLGGGIVTFCPLYVTEISEDHVRGTLASFVMLNVYCGVLLSYLVGSYTSYNTLAAVAWAIPMLYIVSFYFLPETPTYLVKTGQNEKARKSLMWLRNGDRPQIDEELQKLNERFEKENASSSGRFSLKDLFSTRGNRKAFLIITVLTLNSSFTGFLVVLNFTVTIFQESGSDLSPNISTIIVGVLQVFGALLSPILMDRAGRRVLHMTSNSILFILLAISGTYFHLKWIQYDVTGYGWIPLVCLCCYVITIGFGPPTIVAVLMNELFPSNVKFFGISWCSCLIWLPQFAITRVFLPLTEMIGIGGCYFIFGTCCFGSIIFTYFFLPETKNRSLESIHKELDGLKEENVEDNVGVINLSYKVTTEL